MTIVQKIRENIRKWGQFAALRNAKKEGIPFIFAYVAVFHRIPKVL